MKITKSSTRTQRTSSLIHSKSRILKSLMKFPSEISLDQSSLKKVFGKKKKK